jgi:hypothetical protein
MGQVYNYMYNSVDNRSTHQETGPMANAMHARNKIQTSKQKNQIGIWAKTPKVSRKEIHHSIYGYSMSSIDHLPIVSKD